ncbi:uncharacterized protein ASPGLDRAFT_1442817 [Aspergillus glaucus CBS 516.65]|uniref:Uncharacterized protein n=1 Tax=Aspergillus glaucus CBS 516.65 TaxID=1160497 RepID=A0A1L9VN51_ASPGL|nr:hypothetical protein ASPGLDRAFT_1442817 [Aspergillus glaucus CBS 516.65]OJJ85345.1 hypothetical protein ASPGLDRAFT_1442817 [Aspergillus glaucus CBS 516.65]
MQVIRIIQSCHRNGRDRSESYNNPPLKPEIKQRKHKKNKPSSQRLFPFGKNKEKELYRRRFCFFCSKDEARPKITKLFSLQNFVF